MAMEKLEGAPKDAPKRYDGQERFTDGDFKVSKGYTAEMALAALHIDPEEPKPDVEAQLAAAEENMLLPPAAFAACRKAGYRFP